MRETCTQAVPEDFFEELLYAEKLGYFFSHREDDRLVPNPLLAAQYPED